MKIIAYSFLFLTCFSFFDVKAQYWNEGQLDPDFYSIDQVIYGSFAPHDSIAVVSPDTSLALADGDNDFQAQLHFTGAWFDTAYVFFTNTGQQHYYSSDFSDPDTLYIFRDQSGSPAGNEFFKIFNDSAQGALTLRIERFVLNNPFAYRWTTLYFNALNQVEKIEHNSIPSAYTHLFYYTGNNQRPDSSHYIGFDEYRYRYYNTNGITDSVSCTFINWNTYLNHNVAGQVTSILSLGSNYHRKTEYLDRPSSIATADWLIADDNLLYPNPVENELLIPGLTRKIPYELFDLYGRSLRKGMSREQINVWFLEPGHYYLFIAGRYQSFIKR